MPQSLLRAIYIYLLFYIISNGTVINTTMAKIFLFMYNSADEELK